MWRAAHAGVLRLGGGRARAWAVCLLVLAELMTVSGWPGQVEAAPAQSAEICVQQRLFSNVPPTTGPCARTATASATASLPGRFQESIALGGLSSPTAVRFSPDGRVFVAEKSGLILVYDSLDAPTPKIFADLRTNVYNYWDRGLIGLA